MSYTILLQNLWCILFSLFLEYVQFHCCGLLVKQNVYLSTMILTKYLYQVWVESGCLTIIFCDSCKFYYGWHNEFCNWTTQSLLWFTGSTFNLKSVLRWSQWLSLIFHETPTNETNNQPGSWLCWSCPPSTRR